MSSVYIEEEGDEINEGRYEQDEQWFQGQEEEEDQMEVRLEECQSSSNQVSVADSPLTF